MISLLNIDNKNYSPRQSEFDLIYADMMYEDKDLSWIGRFWGSLRENGIFIVQTDWHTNYKVREYLELLGNFVNHLVWKNEWGNHPKNKFHQCYDDIIIFSKGKDYKFYSDRIQVDKKTKTKGLNPSGRITKTATAWIDDICLTTTANERVKMGDGHLIKYQKPMLLMQRIIEPFTDKGDTVFDPFMGSGTLGLWCKQNDRSYVGIEKNNEPYLLACERIYGKN